MRVIDNVFDNRYLFELVDKLKKTAWYPDNIANVSTYPYGNVGSHVLLGSSFFFREDINTIDYGADRNFSLDLIQTFYAIQRAAGRNLMLYEISGNMQMVGMDGTNHYDNLEVGGQQLSNVFSYILMLSGDQGEGGQFVNDTEGVEVPFLNGRLIEITSKELHRGMAFTTPNKVRYSLKFVGVQH